MLTVLITKVLQNQKGMASIEMLPLLFVFVFMFAYALGAFGIVFTGIKNSIGARAYALETFRHRTNLVYFRDDPGAQAFHYAAFGDRLHGIDAETLDAQPSQDLRATERALRMGITLQPDGSRNDSDLHVARIPAAAEVAAGARNQATVASPVWIMINYGICLNLKCGD